MPSPSPKLGQRKFGASLPHIEQRDLAPDDDRQGWGWG
jgi:hypothetical protein